MHRTSFHTFFSLRHVLVEKRKGTTDASLKTQVNEIYMKACKKAKVVCFFAVLKPKADFHYEIVLECTTPQKVTDRLNQWKSLNFIAMSPESTNDFDSCDRQEYNIKLSGNIKKGIWNDKTSIPFKTKKFPKICYFLRKSRQTSVCFFRCNGNAKGTRSNKYYGMVTRDVS